MILKIVKKEVLESLVSLRFMLSVILVVSLFATSAFVFVSSYRQQLQDYGERTNKNLSALREQTGHLYEVALHEQEIWRKPKPLGLCAEGFEESLPNYFKMNAFSMRAPEAKSRSNFMLPPFNDIDWVFFIGTVLSFIALVLTYDAVSGEREAGTLRLMLAGPAPRDKVLVGKYVGTMLTLGIPLLLGMLVNLIIVRSYGIVAITPGDWLKIAAILLLSLAYLSVFVLLGLFVSSRAQHSVSSMVILLLVWVGLVILAPSSGWLAARAFGKATSGAEMQERLHEAWREVWENVKAGKYGERARSLFDDPNDPRNNPPARVRYREAFTDASNRIGEEYFMQAAAQGRIGRQFTRVSPTVLYHCAAEAIAGTGIERSFNLYGQVKQYQASLMEYIRSKDQEDAESLHLLCEDRSMAEKWKSISHQPVDFEAVPKFQERDLSLGKSLGRAVWDVGLLIAFNVVFFTASYVSFTRYDVR